MKLHGLPGFAILLSLAAPAYAQDVPAGCAACDAATAHGSRWFWKIHCVNGLDQAYPYVNPYPGNYYFRPYSYEMTLEQSRAVVALGGDPLQPYDLGVFESVYRELEGPKPPPKPARTSPAGR